MAKIKKFTCYICHNRDIDLEKNVCHAHESLHVSICDRCRNNHVTNDRWHTGEEWNDFDDRGKCIYCEVCGEGGTLMCCDNANCSHSFCLPCLEAWLGKKVLDDFLADDKLHFACFVCTYKEGETGLVRKYPLYSRFVKESDKFFEENKYVNRSTPSKKEKKPKEEKVIKEFTCFSCFKKHDYTAKSDLPKLHSDLKVAMCKPCYDYLQADDWTFTDGKSDFCVITGDGGEIISCDVKTCTNSFDVATLKKWMDKKEVTQLLEDEDSEFKCFKCNPKLGNYQKFLAQTKAFKNAFKPKKEEREDCGNGNSSNGTAKKERREDRERSRQDADEESISPSKKRMREDGELNGLTPSKQKKVSESDARKHILATVKSLDPTYKETEIYRKVCKLLK